MGIICQEDKKKGDINIGKKNSQSSVHLGKTNDGNAYNNPKDNNLKQKDLSISNSNDIMSNNDDNSNYESTEKEIKHDKIIQNFSSLDEYKNKNQIQDTFFESTEGRDDSVYIELKKLEKEQLKREFEKNILNHKKNISGKLSLKVNNDLIQNIIEMQDAKYIFKNKIIENINS